MECETELWNVSTILLRNKKYVPCFYQVVETRVGVAFWGTRKTRTNRQASLSTVWILCPNFIDYFYNSLDTRGTCFKFLLEHSVTKKRKQLVYIGHQNVNSLCLRHHYVTAPASSGFLQPLFSIFQVSIKRIFIKF